MLCTQCKKNEATVHFEGHVNNKSLVLDLCAPCAKMSGIQFPTFNFGFGTPFIEFPSAPPLFSQLFAALAQMPRASRPAVKPQACPQCRWTLQKFRSTGKMGCPDCYGYFHGASKNILKIIHGTFVYSGSKTPGAAEGSNPPHRRKEKTSDLAIAKWAAAPPSWITTAGPDIHGIVLSSRARLARNLKGDPFAHNASDAAQKRVLDAVLEAAQTIPELKTSHSFLLADLSPIEKNFLMERHLISHEHASTKGEKGLIVGGGESVSIMINEEDHIRAAYFEPGLALQDAWTHLSAVESHLSQSLSFGFDQEFGFITACPTNMGSGLRASALMHLPGLHATNRTAALVEESKRQGLALRGFYGEGTQPMGHIFQISNANTLALSEEDTVKRVEKAVQFIAAEEKKAQEILMQPKIRIQTEDIIGRSLGTLQSARLLNLNEGMSHLSNVRLGLMLGLKLPVTLELVTNLIFLIQPAHLRLKAGAAGSSKPDEGLRAEYVREKFRR